MPTTPGMFVREIFLNGFRSHHNIYGSEQQPGGVFCTGCESFGMSTWFSTLDCKCWLGIYLLVVLAPSAFSLRKNSNGMPSKEGFYVDICL